jgi:hypothetical protein
MNARAVMVLRVALMGALVPGPILSAQAGRLAGPGFRTRPAFGVGYVATIPVTPVGFSALLVTPRLLHGAGLYTDVKLTTHSHASDPSYLPDVTVEQAEFTFGDRVVEQKSDWVTIDLAMVYAVTGDFAVYGGAGYSREKHYRQYYDASKTRGDFGFYWIADPAASGTRVNVLGGALARVGRFFYFQMGAESEPRAINLGLTIMIAH